MMTIINIRLMAVREPRPLDGTNDIPLIGNQCILEKTANEVGWVLLNGHLHVGNSSWASGPDISEFLLEFGSSLSHGFLVSSNLLGFSGFSVLFSLLMSFFSSFCCLFEGFCLFFESIGILFGHRFSLFL